MKQAYKLSRFCSLSLTKKQCCETSYKRQSRVSRAAFIPLTMFFNMKTFGEQRLAMELSGKQHLIIDLVIDLQSDFTFRHC